jgi:uncharacterized protein (DUF3820 family)
LALPEEYRDYFIRQTLLLALPEEYRDYFIR